MFAPFAAMVPRFSGVGYSALERAAKALRADPARYLASVLLAAHGGVRLPPKSTRFRPKPIRGLLLRPLP